MKAKEYAQRIIDAARKPNDEFNKVLYSVTQDLFGEIVELVQLRHCATDAAYISIFDEIDDKYQAICRIVNTKLGVALLYRTGFRELAFKIADKAGMWQMRVVWHPKKISGE